MIPVCGVLVHGAAYGLGGIPETSYGSIRRALAAALADSSVTGIALYIDSPGGEVAGCADMADAIAAAQGAKPLHAIVGKMACSAAYWLASACNRVTVPRTGIVGSVGVLMLPTNVTGAPDRAGITITTIQYGERKTDTQPTTKLTKGARERLQAEVDQVGNLFTATVARNRDLRAQDVRALEAGTFLGPDPMQAGLADEVASTDDAFLTLMDAAAGRHQSRRSAQRPGITGVTRAATSRPHPGMTVTTRTRTTKAPASEPEPATRFLHLHAPATQAERTAARAPREPDAVVARAALHTSAAPASKRDPRSGAFASAAAAAEFVLNNGKAWRSFYPQRVSTSLMSQPPRRAAFIRSSILDMLGSGLRGRRLPGC